jgi:hypothetical protein
MHSPLAKMSDFVYNVSEKRAGNFIESNSVYMTVSDSTQFNTWFLHYSVASTSAICGIGLDGMNGRTVITL